VLVRPPAIQIEQRRPSPHTIADTRANADARKRARRNSKIAR